MLAIGLTLLAALVLVIWKLHRISHGAIERRLDDEEYRWWDL